MATTEDTQATNRLSDRLRNGLTLAQTRIHTMEERAKHQWTDLPAQLRTALDRAFARIRTTLDLPSRADVSDLMDRIEALDRKIGALETRQGKRAGTAGSRAAAGASESVADAELETAESADTTVAAAGSSDITGDDEVDARGESASEGSAGEEGASKDTSRKTLQASKGTSAGKTLKASDATTRPIKNGNNRSKSAKQRSKHHGGKGGKG